QAFARGACEFSDRFDRLAIGAVANDPVSLRMTKIGDRQAVGGDPKCQKLLRDQAGAKLRRRAALDRIAGIDRAEGSRGRKVRPLRRAEPLHAPALLIDEDRRFVVSGESAKFLSQSSDLRWAFTVALEKDEAPRLHRREELPLGRVQPRTGAADDQRFLQ